MTREEALRKLKAWDFLNNDEKEVLETLIPEFQESKNERIRRELIEHFRWNAQILNDFDNREVIAWLEKQGEQRLTTKFNVGDWIVSDCNNAAYIESISETKYNLQCIDGYHDKLSIEYVDRCWHLWTIQDIKEGDVLSNGKMIVIFKHFEEPSYRQAIVAYIGLDIGGDIQITDNTWRLGIDKAKPATKEQRDTLFAKMKEAGYMWNKEKKELKKIETPSNSNSWAEEDNDMFDTIESWLDTLCEYLEDSSSECIPNVKFCINWLKSLKQRMEEQQQ